MHQPEEVEEAADNARLVDEEDGSERVLEVVKHSFSFPSPKRERKLSDEGQQEEAKRPKSPEREGMQLAEQHGSGGEGGEGAK